MANFNRLYKSYLIKYNAAVEKAYSKGEPMFDSTPLNRIEFENMYETLSKDMRKAGKRITEETIMKNLVDTQTYSRTLAQAQALKKAFAERGLDITVHEARVWGGLEGDETAPQNFQHFWKEIDYRRNILKSQGYSSADISKFIAMEFFGS